MLHGLFSSCSEWGLLSSCGVQASHCGDLLCVGFSLVLESGVYFLVAVHKFLIVVSSLVVGHRLQVHRLSSYSAQA